MSDLIYREAALAAAMKVRDEAKAFGIPQMAMGASKVADDLRTIQTHELAPEVKVKPLVWVQCEGDLWSSEGAYLYFIDKVKRGFSVNGVLGVQDTLEEAKAAAQADYEARILSALDLPDAQKGEAR